MNNNLTLQKILACILEEKLSFLYYASSQKIFIHIADALRPYLLKMAHNKAQGQCLLFEQLAMPMVSCWEIRFHNNAYQNDFIIFNQKLYYLCVSNNNEHVALEGSEEQLAIEQRRFYTEWQASEHNLANFAYLKTSYPILPPTDYYFSEWDISLDILDEIKRNNLSTYILNLKEIQKSYQQFTRLLPQYKVYYSIKTNPDHKVLQLLHQMGAFFEVVSFSEIELAFKAGASPDHLLFSAPVKRIEDIKKAYHAGVKLFVADCLMEIDKLAKYAPNSYLIVRIKSPDNGALIKLSSKYGLAIEEVIDILEYAQTQGLVPYGISFHVGGQNTVPDSWLTMQTKVHELFTQANKQGLNLQLVNIGGGFPIKLNANVPNLEQIAVTLTNTQQANLSYCAEPGRVIVGHAAKLVCPIISAAERKDGTWLYIDASIFGSLFMMGFHGFKYPITTDHYHLDVHCYHIASLSCDGGDIIAQNILLPKGINQTHLLFIHLVGAYSLPIFDVAYAGVSKTEVRYIQ